MKRACAVSLILLIAILVAHALTPVRADADAPYMYSEASTSHAHFQVDNLESHHSSPRTRSVCEGHSTVVLEVTRADCGVGKGVTQVRDDDGPELGGDVLHLARADSANSATVIFLESTTQDPARRRAFIQVFLI